MRKCKPYESGWMGFDRITGEYIYPEDVLTILITKKELNYKTKNN
jgi:hypothetical protein